MLTQNLETKVSTQAETIVFQANLIRLAAKRREIKRENTEIEGEGPSAKKPTEEPREPAKEPTLTSSINS